MFTDLFKSTYEVNWEHNPEVEEEYNTILNIEISYLHNLGDASNPI